MATRRSRPAGSGALAGSTARRGSAAKASPPRLPPLGRSASPRALWARPILGGARSDTDGLGALTASIARHTSLPHLANVESLASNPAAEEGGRSLRLAVTVRGDGRKRRLAVGVPFVMSVVRGDAAPATEEPARPHDPDRSIATCRSSIRR